MFKRFYFTDEDFELWIKTYNKARYLFVNINTIGLLNKNKIIKKNLKKLIE